MLCGKPSPTVVPHISAIGQLDKGTRDHRFKHVCDFVEA